jgi:hypothetical protein
MLAKFVAYHLPVGNLAISLSKNKIKLWNYTIQIIVLRYFNALKRVMTRKLFNTSDGGRMFLNIENIEQVAEYLIKEENVFFIKKE